MKLDLHHPEFLAKLDHLARLARKVLSGEVAMERSGKGRTGSGTLFQEHRTYSPGDDPRTVDWNIYGRLGELFVKVFEPEESTGVNIYLDRSPSMNTGGKARLATELAAAFGYIGLVDLAGIRSVPFPSKSGREYHGQGDVIPFLTDLEKFQPQGREDLLGTINRASKGYRRESFSLLISDFYPTLNFEKALLRLGKQKVLCLHVVAPEELQPDYKGFVRLENPENNFQKWMPVTKRIRNRYHELIQSHLREVSLIASKRQAAYFRVATDTPFDAAVMEMLTRGILPQRGQR